MAFTTFAYVFFIFYCNISLAVCQYITILSIYGQDIHLFVFCAASTFIFLPPITTVQEAEDKIYHFPGGNRSTDTDSRCYQLRSVTHKQRTVISRIPVTDYRIIRFYFHPLISSRLRSVGKREDMICTPILAFHADSGKIRQSGFLRIQKSRSALPV